ncbi:hypothetical protein [Streptomyces sp. NPDC001401]|uniref:hypothetical protein n=1 Tax=Streptomyces sp. NPDC001401 TaxID=3364570 RepID=UPI00369F4621
MGRRGRTLVLSGPQGTERVEDPAPAVAEALRRMELGPVLLANLLQSNGGEGAWRARGRCCRWCR